ncbi:MAG: globin domain-containing protein [Pseudomonadota bacterium]
MKPDDAALVVRALELAADRGGDLTARIYARLFAAHPEMEPLFAGDRSGQARGEMLTRAFETILDFTGERRWAATLIQTEVVNHAGYDVPPAVFGTFFGTVADCVRELLGPDWTAETDAAWTRLLAELDWYVKHPDQGPAATGAAPRFP